MIFAIDFDGTCVTHEYPNVGKNIGAETVLKWLTDEGHQLILYTMRDKQPLRDALGWFKLHDIPLYGLNKNPTQHKWTTSPKAYAHLYIDDAALGCPLVFDGEVSVRPYVDWIKVKQYLEIYLKEDEIT